ncbi:MAG: peptidoglycan bridge formation glycyltransferase FemA/FemB family protein [Actinomycetes bacterium]
MQVRPITDGEHLKYISSRSSVSFLQTPAWGKAKAGWSPISLGWFDNDVLVGAGLMLLRKVPRVNRYLAYLPEGPDLDWDNEDLVSRALSALIEFSKARGVFQIKMGPHVWTRRWSADTIKDAISQNHVRTISTLPPDEVSSSGNALCTVLLATGWTQQAAADSGFGDFQPRYVFQVDLLNKTADELFAQFNQLWRRNIRKAQKEGVTVRIGDKSDLSLFHACYLETAQRDHFIARPLNYFVSMWDAMRSEEASRLLLFIAEHPDHQGAIAATTMTQVGDHAWYSYGASTTDARELRPSNAIQWHMMQQALSQGAQTYDMRGISDTLDPTNHLFGLIQFKLGTGGYAQEYVGEWDFVISPLWAKAFALYMSRR